MDTGVRTLTLTQYRFDVHPDQQACIDWVRENWHDLFDLEEPLDSLRRFCYEFYIELEDWLIGPGEPSSVRIDYTNAPDLESMGIELWKTLHMGGWLRQRGAPTRNMLSEDLPFTGVFCDEWLLRPLREFLASPDDINIRTLLERCVDHWLKCVLEEWEYTYSDESIRDLCEDNEYYFNEDGSIADN